MAALGEFIGFGKELGGLIAGIANHFRGRIAVTSHSRAEAERLRAAGADIVLTPFMDAAERAVELLANVER